MTLPFQSHTAIAAKKAAQKGQLDQVIFDENARREFLTGFHKRKVAKTEAAKKKALDRQRQERLEVRREKRRQLRERAEENAKQVESAYLHEMSHAGAMLEARDEESEDEWSGITFAHEDAMGQKEYEDEEVVATVTIVEDVDPRTFRAPESGPVPHTAFSPPLKREHDITKNPSEQQWSAKKAKKGVVKKREKVGKVSRKGKKADGASRKKG